jgi:4-amino-4-deoxy-L-arabinose transferase-like glycosyltransferase
MRFVRWLELLSMAAALGYAVLYLAVSLQRIVYPFELEWMEGGSLEHLMRVLSGEPLYVTPSIDFVPFPYPPFYYYLAALLAAFTGANFLTLRLISLVASLATACVVARFVQRETLRPALGVISAGVFLATWRASGLYFDVARLDSLFCLLVVLSLYLLRFHRGAPGLWSAACVAFLAVMTKQTGAVVAAPVVVWCLWDDWRSRGCSSGRSWPLTLGFALPLLLLVVLASLLLNGVVDEHFLLHILGAQFQHGIRSGMTSFFFARDLVLTLPLACLVAVTWFAAIVLRHGSRRWDGFLFAALSGVLLACLIPRIKVSGAANNLIPAYAWLAILFGIGLHRLAERVVEWRPLWGQRAALVVGACCLGQLAVLFYLPRDFVPTAADLEAGRQLVAKIAAVEGEVLIPGQGYLARLAGKRSYAHQMPASDYAKSGLQQASVLEDGYARALREQRFALIIDSNTAFLRNYPRNGELVRHYRKTGWVFPDASRFVPISGAPIRPGTMWIPRERPGPSAATSDAELPSK